MPANDNLKARLADLTDRFSQGLIPVDEAAARLRALRDAATDIYLREKLSDAAVAAEKCARRGSPDEKDDLVTKLTEARRWLSLTQGRDT
jgi:hypothetical protein